MLIGYDVECTWKPRVTERFLTRMKEIHKKLARIAKKPPPKNPPPLPRPR